ncbi:uncharacterized protein F5891DRAFT_1185980 [Suillus fuscotomentosus]|uniref:Uncharacterized protein n=1 Tax=Suillus fuscotomentosus TaxID=1912939 RepID=A0AAD4EAR9_9AGAM|nr:uncharacterized protein F5891DRAFT_1185980 [Suillus fuscotomentosus]KAG1902843.1 hypothetical protein F5891DRAFT_1185980 [Suillus fuscotomentosus]
MGPPASIGNNLPPGPSVIVEDILIMGPWSAGPYHTGYYARPFPLLVDPSAISSTLPSTNIPLHPDQDSKPGTSPKNCVLLLIDDSLPLKNTCIVPTYPHDASAPPFGVPQPTPQGANKENEIILQDPLADIFRPNGIAKTVPAPALSPIKQTNDRPSISNNKSAAKMDGKKKMQPGAAKNTQNLRAWCWLKQVNQMSGTTEEFHVYWAALMTAQQDEYKADTERLQSAGTWTKGSDCAVCDGTLY